MQPFKRENFSLDVSPSIGTVSGIALVPEDAVALLTLAHGAGADMNHVFMSALAEALAALKIATLRFNFPFMENKKFRPDVPAVAHLAVAAIVKYAIAHFPALPLYLSGKSFGGRMSSQWLSVHQDAPVKGIIFYGFPLHPAKQPSVTRAEHLQLIKHPMLFLQGTKDTLADWKLIEELCASLPTATLVRLEGADHAFKKGKEDLVPALATATAEWLQR